MHLMSLPKFLFCLDREACENSIDPDQLPQTILFNQGYAVFNLPSSAMKNQ